jgi:hypothetical protein
MLKDTHEFRLELGMEGSTAGIPLTHPILETMAGSSHEEPAHQTKDGDSQDEDEQSEEGEILGGSFIIPCKMRQLFIPFLILHLIPDKDITAFLDLKNRYECFSFVDGDMFLLILGVFAK